MSPYVGYTILTSIFELFMWTLFVGSGHGAMVWGDLSIGYSLPFTCSYEGSQRTKKC